VDAARATAADPTGQTGRSKKCQRVPEGISLVGAEEAGAWLGLERGSSSDRAILSAFTCINDVALAVDYSLSTPSQGPNHAHICQDHVEMHVSSTRFVDAGASDDFRPVAGLVFDESLVVPSIEYVPRRE